MKDKPINSPAWGVLCVIAIVKILLHAYWDPAYGYFRDELYYLDCADHLAWGYVDHPPLSIIFLAAIKSIIGTSLIALRASAALVAAGAIVVSGLIAWRIGGGRFAQGLTALSFLIAPVYLGVGSAYSMNVFDQLFWALAAYALVHTLTSENARGWRWFGVVAGVALLNKISIAFLGFGVIVGLVLTSNRRCFASKELWIGGAIAAIIFLPHLVWQATNGFPTAEFIENATRYKIAPKSASAFALGQIVEMHPANALIWIAGIGYGLFARSARHLRLPCIAFVAVFALLAARGAKVYYLSPAFFLVLPIGALAIERLTNRRLRLRPALAGVLALSGVATAPLALPVLPPQRYQRFTEAIGLEVPAEERGDAGAPLPQHLADRTGWEELTATIAEAYHRLDPVDKERCSILCGNYGEAGAVNFFGHKYGLPRAITGHNNHFLWGPQGATGAVMLIYSRALSRDRFEELFESVTEFAYFEHPFVMPGENKRTLLLCRGLRIPFEEFWRQVKIFI